MDNLDVLRKLFDEKIILTLNTFLDNPQESLSLTQISDNSKVNNATTLRILDKLMAQNIIELVRVGKSKVYRLKQTQKTLLLTMIIKKEHSISEIIDLATHIKGMEKIILESRTKNSAKFIFVTSTEQKSALNEIVKKIQDKHKYQLVFLELTEKQFNDMEKFGLGWSSKIVWEKNKSNQELSELI
ncbi:MAG TPA: hypothetical protein V6C58_07555 [Allocoleopsis sp.]